MYLDCIQNNALLRNKFATHSRKKEGGWFSIVHVFAFPSARAIFSCLLGPILLSKPAWGAFNLFA